MQAQPQSMSSSSQPQSPVSTLRHTVPNWTRFACAGTSGATAWLFVHPLDVCKVRMQINEGGVKVGAKPPNMLSTFRDIIRTESPLALYNGLSAGIMRQLVYGSMRVGLYDTLRPHVAKWSGTSEPTFAMKLGMGLVSGGVAAFCVNPVEVSLVRMQADGQQKNLALKRNYKNVFDALFRVTREEGVLTLYRGVSPTITRGMVVSMVQLSSYDQSKTLLRHYLPQYFGEGISTHSAASFIAGFLYSFASLPFDICKTRMQNQHGIAQPDGKLVLEYRSIPQTFGRIFAQEGPLSLWKGFLPYWARGGTHTIVMFICLEQYKNFVKYLYGCS